MRVLLAGDGHLFDDRYGRRLVAHDFDARDLVDRLHRPAFTKNRVAAIEVIGCFVRDEKLRAVRIRATIGHA